jgi:hypothetical protein
MPAHYLWRTAEPPRGVDKELKVPVQSSIVRIFKQKNRERIVLGRSHISITFPFEYEVRIHLKIEFLEFPLCVKSVNNFFFLNFLFEYSFIK